MPRKSSSPKGNLLWLTLSAPSLVLQRRLFSQGVFHEPLKPGNLLP